jgi:hypothetical protein
LFRILSLALLVPASAYAAPVLTVSGACPGPVTIEATGAGSWALLSANAGGSNLVPGGPCAGEMTGLGAGMAFRGIHSSPLSPTLPGAACGAWLQALDVDTCEFSAVVPVMGAGGTFTACGATGQLGPDQVACDAAYAGGDLEGSVTVTAGMQMWRAPKSAAYTITAVGAQGASSDVAYKGGLGAKVCGVFEMAEGTDLTIVVGQMGLGEDEGSNGGGGGGSFVVDGGGDPWVIAGGGGGTRASVVQNGCDAMTGEAAGSGSGGADAWDCAGESTGEIGMGGAVSSSSWGSGGAGIWGDGDTDGWDGTGGLAWAGGMTGGNGGTCGFPAEGGFGGGGSGNGCHGGGGGGGYTGGEGGRLAGGGGSYNGGAAGMAEAGHGAGDGWVEIKLDDGSGCM